NFWEGHYSLNLGELQNFLSEFSTERSEEKKGFIFTLNQDLFLERHFYRALPTKSLPKNLGINELRYWFTEESGRSYGEVVRIEIPTDEEMEVLIRTQLKNGRLFYVKLHGSQNWFTKKTNLMVIGANKLETIRKYPLLLNYYNLFSYV